LAKRLKELGVKQESYFYWDQCSQHPEGILIPSDSGTIKLIGCEWYSAFTVAELGDMLPDEVATNKYTEPDLKTFFCKLHVEGDWQKYIEIIEADTEADARAQMLIYLLE